MNVWKPIAIVLGAALVASVGLQTASAQNNTACKGQPNMANALSSLQAAKASLEKAEQNKGGWRDAALTATKTAIAQTQTGCGFADGH